METDTKWQVIEVDDVRVRFDVWSGGGSGGQRTEVVSKDVRRGGFANEIVDVHVSSLLSSDSASSVLTVALRVEHHGPPFAKT